ncbi:MAG: leucine--tRNA ligase [Parcubacteria group bacterium]|nr:leucine--tRNA ligase [Parcubacteria group bacterium]
MYAHQSIEQKWQKKWEEEKIYKTREDYKKSKCYILDMFPYPSGAGLHVGHLKGYIASDIAARYKRMKGFNVLHPMGWDAFGLPAENYALKNRTHPSIAVSANIKKYKEQLSLIGFSYDWDREINTTDPQYYKWTQWCFLKMFEKGLAYESNEPINWCPSCLTGLANEDLENGKCERCGSEVVQKPMRQWVLKITEYAERLLEDLKLLNWEPSIMEQQKHWIGKSEGVEFELSVKGAREKIRVYTTRIDTVFGMSFIVLAPEHPLVLKLVSAKHKSAVLDYQERAAKKTVFERMELQKEKTGVFIGAYAINPFNKQPVPIYIGDYVLMSYGTGAVMGAPAHDERDFAFAQTYDLPIREVIRPKEGSWNIKKSAFIEDGILVDSGDFSDLDSGEARKKMAIWLKAKKMGDVKTHYRMKDWVFSRQRYWGEPIPLVHCEKCGVVPVPDEELPVLLPEVEHYEPTGTGESPLANISDWVNTKCPSCGGPGKRETNTMPQWAGSCWYYLRFIDPKNRQALVDALKEKYWMNVDLYVGGAEHATRHLLYARFWHKVLYDIGAVSTQEPFQKLYHVGLVLGEDSRKMSKRWGNVVNPEDVVAEYGADALRLYEMFMGPFSDAIPWNIQGLKGTARFLDKIWALKDRLADKESAVLNRLIHKTIKKVGEDIESFDFNTAVSALMILINESGGEFSNRQWELVLKLLAPFAPHLAEELWEQSGHKESILQKAWPEYDLSAIKEDEAEIAVQVNSKTRDSLKVPADIAEEEIKKLALKLPKVQKYTEGKRIERVVYVQRKLINFFISK